MPVPSPDPAQALARPDAAAMELVADLVAECIVNYERGGEPQVSTALRDRPSHVQREVAAQFAALREAGLLLEPARDPERIGAYRIVRRIGIGGMGVVYLAEQEAPVARQVAIKLIRPGMDTREVLARFAVERQSLALLDHPHLARIFDAGATADGRPFLVMDYVDGLPITRFCDERRLGMRERLQLFLSVCDTVQHAHHRGIIHRDLKPSNILVTERDGVPWPVLIDFGVAKSLTPRPGAEVLLTSHGQLLGTPEYMSPEQAENQQAVDTRTDVYSLGVVLYELLTGTLPIVSSQLRSQPYRELYRLLRDTDPPTPSSRVSRLGQEARLVAMARCIEPAALRRALRGDLDWVVLRALARDRERRYGMPAELAADVRRYLACEPVAAGPPSAWYRGRKFLRRHRVPVASFAAVLFTLLVGLVTSLVFYSEAEASARQADGDRQLAERERQRAEGSAQRTHDSLQLALSTIDRVIDTGLSDLRGIPRAEQARLHLLEEACALQRNLVERSGQDEPYLLATLVRTVTRLAAVCSDLGLLARAGDYLDEADRIADSLSAEVRSNPYTRVDLASLQVLRGMWWSARDQDDRALECLRAAERELQQLAELQLDDARVPTQLLQARQQQAFVLQRTDPEAAFVILQQALPAARAVLQRELSPSEQMTASRVVAGLLIAYLGRGQMPDAVALEPLLRPFVDRVLAGDDPLQQCDALLAIDALIRLEFLGGDLARARADMELALASLREAARRYPDLATVQVSLATVLGNYSMLLQRAGTAAEVAAVQRESIALNRAQLARQPDNQSNRSNLVTLLFNIAGSAWQQSLDDGGLDAAATRRDLDQARAEFSNLPASMQQLPDLLCAALQGYGAEAAALAAAGDAGDAAAAAAACEAGIAAAEDLLQRVPNFVTAVQLSIDLRLQLGWLQLQAGRLQAAAVAFGAAAPALDDLRQQPGRRKSTLRRLRHQLAGLAQVHGLAGDAPAMDQDLQRLLDLDDAAAPDLAVTAHILLAVARRLDVGDPQRPRLHERARIAAQQALSSTRRDGFELRQQAQLQWDLCQLALRDRAVDRALRALAVAASQFVASASRTGSRLDRQRAIASAATFAGLALLAARSPIRR